MSSLTFYVLHKKSRIIKLVGEKTNNWQLDRCRLTWTVTER